MLQRGLRTRNISATSARLRELARARPHRRRVNRRLTLAHAYVQLGLELRCHEGERDRASGGTGARPRTRASMSVQHFVHCGVVLYSCLFRQLADTMLPMPCKNCNAAARA